MSIMNHLRLLLIVFAAVLTSCKKDCTFYEPDNEELERVAKLAKFNYDDGLPMPSFYETPTSFCLVSFSNVASCQKDTLQKKLSEERANVAAIMKLTTLSSCNILSIYDATYDFSPAKFLALRDSCSQYPDEPGWVEIPEPT